MSCSSQRFRTHIPAYFADMAVRKGDCEQQAVESVEKHPQGEGDSPKNLIEASVFKLLRNLAVSLMIASIALICIMMSGLKDFQTPISFTVFLVGVLAALFVSILVVIVIEFRNRITPMFISKVLLCAALGFFIMSLLAATLLLVPLLARWLPLSVGVIILEIVYSAAVISCVYPD